MKIKGWTITKDRAGHSMVLATLSRKLSKAQIRRIAQAISSQLGKTVQIHPNPTLVHHGLTDRAAWHVFGESEGQKYPIADLYQGDLREARKIASHIADVLGEPMALVSFNEDLPSLEEHYRRADRVLSARAVKRRKNPAGDPREGEVWTTAQGGRCKVLQVTPSRVQVLHMESGAREWIDKPEFFASYKPPRTRRNPKGRRSEFSIGDVVSISAMPYFGRYGTVVALGSKYITVEIHLTGKRVKFLPDHLRLTNVRAPRVISRKITRAARRATRRAMTTGAFPGNAAQPIYYLERHRARAARRRGNPKRNLTVPEQHQLKIARQTLRLRPEFVRIMGGMTVEEAREIIYRLTGKKTNPSRTKTARKRRASKTAGRKFYGRRYAKAERRGDAARRMYHKRDTEKRTMRNTRGEYHRGGPPAGSMWRRLGVPSYVARVAKTERAKGGMPPMVNLEVMVAGNVTGTTRVPVNEFFANHEPIHRNPVTAAQRLARLRRGPRPLSHPRKGESWRDPQGGVYHVVNFGAEVVTLRSGEGIEFPIFWPDMSQWRKVSKNPAGPRPGNDRNFAIATIRKALKQRSGKSWSVTGGTGTAWGWIHIDAPPKRRTWQHVLPPGMRDESENYVWVDSGKPGGYTGPPELKELAKLLGLDYVHFQGVSIPASSDYREEYMDRAQGVEPHVIGTPYWDNPLPRWVDRRSIRSVARGRDGILVGCPSGAYHPRKRGKRKCSRPMRRVNPSTELERAKRTSKMWNEFPATRVKRLRVPSRTIPKHLVQLGQLHTVVYRSNKYDGKYKLHEHRFKRPLPVLTSDPDGRTMHIVGGGYSITGDGIVN